MKQQNRVVELRPLVNWEHLERRLDKLAREENRRRVTAARKLCALIIVSWLVLAAIYESAARLL